MTRCLLHLRGLDCAVEADAVRSVLSELEGVRNLEFDLLNGTLTVEFDEQHTNPEAIQRLIAHSTGMSAEILPSSNRRASASDPVVSWIGARLKRWCLVAISGFAVVMGQTASWMGGARWLVLIAFGFSIMAVVPQLVPRAWRGLIKLRLDIHVLMTLAVLGAMALGQWDEAATVAFLFGLSEALESMSLERARRAVRTLLEITPELADLITADGETRVVPARSIVTGEHVLVRPGQNVPVDGRVLLGRSSIDQKNITGESLPVSRAPGDAVFAGTVNGEGTLEVVATSPLEEAVVSRVIERVRAAQRGRTPLEQSIDRFARWYTPAVVVLAFVVMFVPPLFQHNASWRWWIHQGLVVLVIACPCALVIATPVAVVSALTAAARRGILIKSGQFLEMFGRLRVLAFDKTGTLTQGTPDVVEVVPHAGQAGEEVVRIAAALGDRGGHVLGRAIARHARRLALDVPKADNYQAIPGLGATARVEATEYYIGSHRYLDEYGLCPPDFHTSLGMAEQDVGTAVAISTAEEPLGWLRLSDTPRPEAARVLRELRSLGVEPVMLTGDNAATAEAVARELGITEQRSELLPEEKAAAVKELDARCGPTGMVGDGVNDAPALAAARVSVSMGGIGSAAALETADVVLMADDLSGLPWLVRHSRHAVSTIQANIALAVGAKALFLILAVLGFANLWIAIAADMGVSLLVVAFALRLLRSREPAGARGLNRHQSTPLAPIAC